MPVLPNTDSPLVECLTDNPNHISAYKTCLKFEKIHAESKDKLRFVRILGFLLLHAPNQGVRSEVSRCIHSLDGDIASLGQFFERYIILPFKKFRGPTPKSSEHPSQPSFEREKNERKVDITQAPTHHEAAKRQALIRDGWKCIVTGTVHAKAPPDVDPTAEGVLTECAHIIPEGLFFGLVKTEGNVKLDYSASVLTVLKEFHYNISEFNGAKIHSLTNILTLDPTIHGYFDMLLLYLEATSQENCYEVKYFGRKPRDARKTITLTTPDPELLPLPSPNLLALHATCCKVAHFSGSAEYLDQIYCEADELNVLSADGTSGEVLSYALLSRPQLYIPTHVIEQRVGSSEKH